MQFRRTPCPSGQAVPTTIVDKELLLPEEQKTRHQSLCSFSGKETLQEDLTLKNRYLVSGQLPKVLNKRKTPQRTKPYPAPGIVTQSDRGNWPSYTKLLWHTPQSEVIEKYPYFPVSETCLKGIGISQTPSPQDVNCPLCCCPWLLHPLTKPILFSL